MKAHLLRFGGLWALLFASRIFAADQLHMRVVDVGVGECIAVEMPGGHYMVYDTGDKKYRTAMAAGFSAIPAGSVIDLLVLSHNDSDHIGNVPFVMKNYKVNRVIWAGDERDSGVWRAARDAIAQERDTESCVEMNLANEPVAPGATFYIGSVVITVVAGYSRPPEDWTGLSPAEKHNAGSIVVRLTYAGRSILLCGDSVGRHESSPPETCIAEEKFMVDHAGTVPIASDVIVAPHHGANNANSLPFIRAVQPTWVIFSAGHNRSYHHPRAAAAQRYIDAGVPKDHILRTDRGDNEGPPEWAWGATRKADKPGDDDIDITITKTGELTVAYRPPVTRGATTVVRH